MFDHGFPNIHYRFIIRYHGGMTGTQTLPVVALPFYTSIDIIAMAGTTKAPVFLSNSRNRGIKSGLKEFDMVPESPASSGNEITIII